MTGLSTIKKPFLNLVQVESDRNLQNTIINFTGWLMGIRHHVKTPVIIHKIFLIVQPIFYERGGFLRIYFK